MKVQEIILHCSATREGQFISTNDIDRWHRQRGFNKIGYHYVIYLDGSIHKGREDNENGAHCTGHNSKAIGVCYIGGCDKDLKPKDTRTEAQKEATYELINILMTQYHLTLSDVHCHNEYVVKACPSHSIEQFRREYTEWEKRQNKN